MTISVCDGLLRLAVAIEALGGGMYRARPLSKAFERFEALSDHPIEALNRLREKVDRELLPS